jgi:hypothetical protein
MSASAGEEPQIERNDVTETGTQPHVPVGACTAGAGGPRKHGRVASRLRITTSTAYVQAIARNDR